MFIAVALALISASNDDVAAATDDEARAFAALDAHDDCGAAASFRAAYLAAPNDELLRDAALAADRAGDRAWARDLWAELGSARGAHQKEASDNVAKSMSLIASSGRGKICDRGSMEDRVAVLERELVALKRKSTGDGPGVTAADNVPVDDSPVLGDPKSPVALVAFLDFQCPFCERSFAMLEDVAHDPELERSVHVVFKNFPLSFHQNALPAAKAALAARAQGDDKFWAFARALFAHQKDLAPELYEMLAADVGLDVARFKRDLAAHDDAYAATIRRDQAEGAAISVKGTPTYLVGGWALTTRSVDGVKELIAAHDLATASGARSDGFKRVRSKTGGAAAAAPAAGR